MDDAVGQYILEDLNIFVEIYARTLARYVAASKDGLKTENRFKKTKRKRIRYQARMRIGPVVDAGLEPKRKNPRPKHMRSAVS